MHNRIPLYDPDVFFRQQTFLIARNFSRISTEIKPLDILDLPLAMTRMEEARSPGMTSTPPWQSLGGPRPFNPNTIATTRWLVCSSTECLGTIIDLFYHPVKPSTSYSNLGQGETNDAGYHFSTDQVPGPTMNFSSYVPEASSNQGASPVWRLHNCWVSHAEQDELHLTIALKKT
jgi:hypothetical protein